MGGIKTPYKAFQNSSGIWPGPWLPRCHHVQDIYFRCSHIWDVFLLSVFLLLSLLSLRPALLLPQIQTRMLSTRSFPFPTLDTCMPVTKLQYFSIASFSNWKTHVLRVQEPWRVLYIVLSLLASWHVMLITSSLNTEWIRNCTPVHVHPPCSLAQRLSPLLTTHTSFFPCP